MPNFVDCAIFRPSSSEELSRRSALRAGLGVPGEAFVVGCVAAVKKSHKRIDYLIAEFASVQNAYPLLPFLLIAGAKTDETDELIALAEALIPGRYKIVTDCSRAQMPDLYRVMDVFVLASLFEMMPIALLEALASGLPCLVNKHPVLEWMTGAAEKTADRRLQTSEDQGEEKEFEQKHAKDEKRENRFSSGGGEENSSCSEHVEAASRSVQNSSLTGGMAIDMSKEGALSQALAGLSPEWIERHGRQARERALKMFSREFMICQYVDYYKEVLGQKSEG